MGCSHYAFGTYALVPYAQLAPYALDLSVDEGVELQIIPRKLRRQPRKLKVTPGSTSQEVIQEGQEKASPCRCGRRGEWAQTLRLEEVRIS